MIALVVALATPVPAQFRVDPVGERPDTQSLELLLRKLSSTGTFMQTDAHPDDEDNGLLAMLGYGQGMRVALVTATRGDGGQNEIGPEQGQALGVLRTEELLAVHRFDGAEQYFTRAIDFGYSFSVDESVQKWGEDAIVGDYVRLIRTIRPDVIVGFLCGGTSGGLHHQASAKLTLEAFRAAGDPARYPDQIEGRPASLAARADLLHRRDVVRSASRPADAGQGPAGRQRVRRGARPNVRGARARGALDAQVPGHVAVAAAAGRGAEPHLQVSGRRRRGRRIAVRRHRHVDRRADAASQAAA